jgi:hypothetical protein
MDSTMPPELVLKGNNQNPSIVIIKVANESEKTNQNEKTKELEKKETVPDEDEMPDITDPDVQKATMKIQGAYHKRQQKILAK